MLTNDTDIDTGAHADGGGGGRRGRQCRHAVAGTYGSVTINSDGSYTYTLDNADRQRADHLAQGEHRRPTSSYTTTDEHGATSTSTLTITIAGTNDAPVAVADGNASDAVVEAGVKPNGNTPEPGDATAAGNVLTNDTDIDTGHTLTVAAVGGVATDVGRTRWPGPTAR